MSAMDLVITLVLLAITHGFAFLSGLVAGEKDREHEAVTKGYAGYEPDSEGKPVFRWKDPTP